MKAVIVDVDGTLAIKADRSPFDWMRVGEDAPNLPIINLVKSLRDEYVILIFSGRDEVCREITIKWLHDNDVSFHALLMRPTGDMRKDCIVKKELYEGIKDSYKIEFVLDDRNQVVEMWRNELGLTCLQVAEGNF